MISGEATDTNFTVFGLTQPGLKPTIYHTRSEHANPYATDAAKLNLNAFYCINNEHIIFFPNISLILT
jgi:hypothetical protein